MKTAFTNISFFRFF